MKRITGETGEEGDVMIGKNYYELERERFDDKVKRELAMPAWERPSMIRDLAHDTKDIL